LTVGSSLLVQVLVYVLHDYVPIPLKFLKEELVQVAIDGSRAKPEIEQHPFSIMARDTPTAQAGFASAPTLFERLL